MPNNIAKVVYMANSSATPEVWMDATPATATAEDITAPKTALLANGILTEGTGTGGGGGSSEWELVASKEVTVSTTSTSASQIEWWYFGDSSAWTGSKAVYVRIRDKAGKRNGYFYGSDTFILNAAAKNGYPNGSSSDGMRSIIRVTSNGEYRVYTIGSYSGYGVFADHIDYDDLNDALSVSLYQRYNSTYSLTIDGTYTVEVYLLSPPNGKPFFT